MQQPFMHIEATRTAAHEMEERDRRHYHFPDREPHDLWKRPGLLHRIRINLGKIHSPFRRPRRKTLALDRATQ